MLETRTHALLIIMKISIIKKVILEKKGGGALGKTKSMQSVLNLHSCCVVNSIPLEATPFPYLVYDKIRTMYVVPAASPVKSTVVVVSFVAYLE